MAFAVILVSAAAAAINFSIATLSFGFSKAPGWVGYRLFAVIAFLLGVYAFNDAVFLNMGTANGWAVVAARTNVQIGGTISVLWMLYFQTQTQTPISWVDRVFVLGVFPVVCIGWIPGVLSHGVVRMDVPSLEIYYLSPEMTWLGKVLIFESVSAMLIVAVRYVRFARQGGRTARMYALGFCLFFVFAFEEVLVSIGVLEFPYLVDLGFSVLLFLAAMDMSAKVSSDSIALQALNEDLEIQVKKYSDELLTTQEALLIAERQAALEQMAAGVGHEINNPLASIRGNLIFLEEGIKKRSHWQEEGEAIGEALEGVTRIQEIVMDLTMFTLGDADSLEVANPQRAIDLAIRMVESKYRTKVGFKVENRSKLGGRIAEGKLTQVLVNLCTNAAFATLETAAAPYKAVEVRCFDSKGCLYIEIEDQGTGIDESVLHRIFDPLFTTKKVGVGTGLGLFVCKSIVDSAGGELSVQCNEGGTTFCIALQTAELPDSSDCPRPEKEERNMKTGLRIYLIDDEPLVTKAIVRMVPQHVFVIENNSEKALQTLLDDPSFDLVLCDLMMPNLTGMELYRTLIQKCPQWQNRFLFITGGAVTGDAQVFVESMETQCLRKPLDLRVLLHAIDQQI